MEENYEKLLESAYKSLPEKVKATERFEFPKADSFNEGNKTIIKNFDVIVTKIRREKSFLIKFLSKEFAVPVTQEADRIVLHRKISNDLLNKKLDEFIVKYVLCKECKKPDTHINDLGHGLKRIVCEACGATNPLK